MLLLALHTPGLIVGRLVLLAKTPANLPGRMNQSDVSESMTAAACCSIYICKLRLPKYLTDVKKKGHRDLPLLVPVKEEEKEVEYKPITEAKLLEDSLGRANNWLTSKARFPAEGPKKVKHFFTTCTRWNVLPRYAKKKPNRRCRLVVKTGMHRVATH